MKISNSGLAWGVIIPTPDKPTLADRVFVWVALVSILTWAFPHLAVAQSVQETPFVFEINQFTNIPAGPEFAVQTNYFAEALKRAKNPKPDQRIPVLNEFLESKRSPIAGHADLLLKQPNHRYVLAISFAEGNYCKHQIRPHNCWGIGGTRPETYANYDQAFTRANDLIQKYHDGGLDTPAKMRTRWVGWQNDSWIRAVNQSLAELEAVGL